MVTLIKLEELKREQEKVYKELVKIKEEERELFIKLQDLKTIEGMKRLQFLQYSNKIAVLEVNEAKKEVYCIKKFNENKTSEKSNENIEKVKTIKIETNYNSVITENKNEPIENKTKLTDEDFDAFQREYLDSYQYRRMLSLNFRDDVVAQLSRIKYCDWETKSKEINTILQKTGRFDTYRGKEIDKNGLVFCMVAPPNDINYSETDVVKYALDKFFKISGMLLPNNAQQQKMEIIMPAVFEKISEEQYELIQKGFLNFK